MFSPHFHNNYMYQNEMWFWNEMAYSLVCMCLCVCDFYVPSSKGYPYRVLVTGSRKPPKPSSFFQQLVFSPWPWSPSLPLSFPGGTWVCSHTGNLSTHTHTWSRPGTYKTMIFKILLSVVSQFYWYIQRGVKPNKTLYVTKVFLLHLLVYFLYLSCEAAQQSQASVCVTSQWLWKMKHWKTQSRYSCYSWSVWICVDCTYANAANFVFVNIRQLKVYLRVFIFCAKSDYF